MENRVLIKIFAILFVLVSIYQISFTFVADNVEELSEIAAYEKVDENKEGYLELRHKEALRYLDSVGTSEVFDIGIASYTYNEVKEKELNMGLDLRGGINVILQISVKDILKGLSNYSKDPYFNKVLKDTDVVFRNSDDTYLDLFFRNFEQSDPSAKLSSSGVFGNKIIGDEINVHMDNSSAKAVIRRKVDESVVSAFEVLRKRIDKFGVTQPNIQRLGKSGRILVELPGAKDIDRVRSLLQSTARLEFWFTYKNSDILPYIFSVNERLKEIVKSEEKAVVAGDMSSQIDSLLTEASADSISSGMDEDPFFKLMKGRSYEGMPVIGTFSVKDTAKVSNYLKMPEIVKIRPGELRYMKFLWGRSDASSGYADLYAVRYNREGKPDLSGGVIIDATQTYDLTGQPAVSMRMNSKGARVWEEMTGKAFKEGMNIAIVLDNIVYSAPGVSKGAISGGSSEITGNFTLNEAIDLANVLRAGKLPASSDIIQSEVVGPSLGQESVERGINSFIAAMIVVLLWMVFYYGLSGLVANIALVVNILLIFGFLASLGAVLTLPGIAGIVLTIGMSVDANVIIFERIKEELSRGKVKKQAISDGFKNALSSILDANITTALTAIILLVFGTGPIKGFATTLLIGIFTSLFTAIYVSRLFIDGFVKRGKRLDFSTFLTKNLFKRVDISFLRKRKYAYVISGILVIISLVSLITKGLNQGVDFVGGRSYQVRFDRVVSPTEVSDNLEKVFGSVEVKTFGTPNQLKITTNYKVMEDDTEVDKEIIHKLYVSLKPYLPEMVSEDHFINGGENYDRDIGVMSYMKVGPTIADDIRIGAFWSVFGSLLVVFLYILLRFRKWQFSFGAVTAVFHDVLIVLGIFSLTYEFMPFSLEIDQAFIAAILTVVGYSLNDTVIVFDRIREYGGAKGESMVNNALNSTLSRTLNTSLTTLVVLVVIFLFGGETLRGFIFAMIIGVAVGTYSSLFIASPMAFDLRNKTDSKKQ